jgi:acyl-CoA synthetase (AMP-forming)/AMP-acid ligase II
VVLLHPGSAITAEEIIRHCGNSLAGYKKPKTVEFVAELPVSGYGKVLRREVRERYWKGYASRIGGGGSQAVPRATASKSEPGEIARPEDVAS